MQKARGSEGRAGLSLSHDGRGQTAAEYVMGSNIGDLLGDNDMFMALLWCDAEAIAA